MKRYSEVVLNGHPDKFSDLLADRLIRAIYAQEPVAYAQIEVSVWSDLIFLTGAVASHQKINLDVQAIIHALGLEIGYTPSNHIDVMQYRIMNHICFAQHDPGDWTKFVNDQSIVVGYAGYDSKTHYLPPEHYLCWYLREQVIDAMNNGLLHGHGPDGKLLITLTETLNGWQIDQILLTLQHSKSVPFVDFTEMACETLKKAYAALQENDARWLGAWKDIRVFINPNGPLLIAGSDGDNGQTGRKLVMDYYGPRIPIGGGALYGKDLTHIDRLGATMARLFALHELNMGAKEVMVRVCYAPGKDDPLSIDIQSDKSPTQNAREFFRYSSMRSRLRIEDIHYELNQLGSFYNPAMTFNQVPPEF